MAVGQGAFSGGDLERLRVLEDRLEAAELARAGQHVSQLRDVLELHRLHSSCGSALSTVPVVALVLRCSERRAGVLLGEALGLALDSYHLNIEEKRPNDAVRAAAGHIAHVQVNDPNLLGPGMGEVKYEPIIPALREIGYDGWLSVEAFDFRPGAEHIARESVRYLRQVVPDAA